MKAQLLIAVLATLLFVPQSSRGVPDLLLSGNEIIPMALVAIPDIGTHDEGMALICRHGITGIPPTSAIDDWKFVSEENMEESITPDLGWSISRGQSDGVVRLERIEGLSPLEGTYKCSVHRIDIGEDTFESVTVYLYWPVTELAVTIEVTSLELGAQMYNVMCMSSGGSIVNSSLTGPGAEGLGQLEPVEGQQQQMRGADNYSISVTRVGGDHGDVFTCTASTIGSSLTVDNTLSVAGPAVDVMAVQVSSMTPTLKISWSPPEDMGVITGYTVYYYGSGTASGGNDHIGSSQTVNDTTVLISQLLADGRTYNMRVAAHSAHLNGYSEDILYNPCIVSQLMVESRTPSSLTIIWDRPSYYSASITGLVQYVPLLPSSNTRWLYVEGITNILPALTELSEFTTYSVQMAVIDVSNTLCVFNQPLIARTGLGPVHSLRAQAEDYGIMFSWSPPTTPTNTSFNYSVAYNTTGRNGETRWTATTTPDLSLIIYGMQGDVYTVTVTPISEHNGESTTVTARIDYEAFQLRVDDIEKCGDWLQAVNTTNQLMDTTTELEGVVSELCACDVQIHKSEFDCQMDDQDFVLFRGQLFAPVTFSAEYLLLLLEDWVQNGATLTFTESNTVNSDCKPAEMFAQSSECVTSTERPIVDTTSESAVMPSSGGIMDDGTADENMPSVAVLAGVAAGCFIVGVIFSIVAALSCYILKGRYKQKSDIKLNQRAHRLASSETCEDNPRYTPAGPPSQASQRDLPLIPLHAREQNLTYSNPAATKGAQITKEIVVDNNQAYEAFPSTTALNPLYEEMDDTKRELKGKQRRQQVTASGYEDVKQLRIATDYVEMHPVRCSTSRLADSAR